MITEGTEGGWGGLMFEENLGSEYGRHRFIDQIYGFEFTHILYNYIYTYRSILLHKSSIGRESVG